MKIILRQDIYNLGDMGDVVTVKDGYARNYLIPKQYAYYATDSAMKRLEAEKKQHYKKIAEQKGVAEELAQKIADLQVTVPMKVGEEGKLYGSVTNNLIAAELDVLGYSIEKRNIIIEDPIKTLGIFDVKVKLHPEVTANLKVWVISEEE